MEQTNACANNGNLRTGGWKSFLLPVLLVLLLVASVLGSRIQLISQIESIARSSLQERLHENAPQVETTAACLYDAIEAVAPTMAFEAGYTQAQRLLGRNALLTACNSDFAVRTNTGGVAFRFLGKENTDLSERGRVRTALTGKTAIERIASGAYDTAHSAVLAGPVVYDGQVVGVLHGSCKPASFGALLTEFASEHISGCDESDILTEAGTLVASGSDSEMPRCFAESSRAFSLRLVDWQMPGDGTGNRL